MSNYALPFTIVTLPNREDERNAEMKSHGYDLQEGEQIYFLYDFGQRKAVHVFAMKSEEARQSNATTLLGVPAKWLSSAELRTEERSTRSPLALENLEEKINGQI